MIANVDKIKARKAIEIKAENIAELWSCPYVCKIERLEYCTFEDEERGQSISSEIDEPHFALFLLGYKLPAVDGYLIQDVHGLWRIADKGKFELQ